MPKKDNSQKKQERLEKKCAVYTKGSFQTTKLTAGSIKFASLYDAPRWQRYLIVIIIGVLMGLVTMLLVKNTGLYQSGMSAVLQGISRVIYVSMTNGGISKDLADLVFNILFWGLFFVCNIPLLIFSYFKIGKTFTLLTLVYVAINSISGFVFSAIPGASEILLFGDTIPSNEVLKDSGVYILTFTTINNSDLISQQDTVNSIFLFIYALIYAFASAFMYALLYIVGSSSAGADIISIYYATVKQKSLGKILVIVNTVCLLTGSTIGSYISAGLINPICFGWQFFLSANLVSSFICVIVFGLVLNVIFPRHKMVKIEVHSLKINEIRKHLLDVNYVHTTTILDVTGGYSMTPKKMMVTISMYIEMPTIVNHIRMIDKDCLIVIYPIIDLDGKMSIQKQGSLE